MHTNANIDCQPYNQSGCLMLVTGHLRMGASSEPRSFSETFVLLPTGGPGQWYVCNQHKNIL